MLLSEVAGSFYATFFMSSSFAARKFAVCRWQSARYTCNIVLSLCLQLDNFQLAAGHKAKLKKNLFLPEVGGRSPYKYTLHFYRIFIFFNSLATSLTRTLTKFQFLGSSVWLKPFPPNSTGPKTISGQKNRAEMEISVRKWFLDQ